MVSMYSCKRTNKLYIIIVNYNPLYITKKCFKIIIARKGRINIILICVHDSIEHEGTNTFWVSRMK